MILTRILNFYTKKNYTSHPIKTFAIVIKIISDITNSLVRNSSVNIPTKLLKFFINIFQEFFLVH